jgi:hypothetical protein
MLHALKHLWNPGMAGSRDFSPFSAFKKVRDCDPVKLPDAVEGGNP